MPNPNHPKKGDCIAVDPIRDMKDIKSIKRLLATKPRDFAIFVTGVNTNLRGSDLLKITVGQVRHLQVGEHFSLREKKTGKVRNITINKAVHEAITSLLKHLGEGVKDSDWLFQSRKGKGRLSIGTLNSMLKEWCSAINMKGNFGSHTLRKTFGYQHRVQ